MVDVVGLAATNEGHDNESTRLQSQEFKRVQHGTDLAITGGASDSARPARTSPRSPLHGKQSSNRRRRFPIFHGPSVPLSAVAMEWVCLWSSMGSRVRPGSSPHIPNDPSPPPAAGMSVPEASPTLFVHTLETASLWVRHLARMAVNRCKRIFYFSLARTSRWRQLPVTRPPSNNTAAGVGAN